MWHKGAKKPQRENTKTRGVGLLSLLSFKEDKEKEEEVGFKNVFLCKRAVQRLMKTTL